MHTLNFETRTTLDFVKLYDELQTELQGELGKASSHEIIRELQVNKIHSNVEVIIRNWYKGKIRKDYPYLMKYISLNNINYKQIATMLQEKR